MNGEASMGECSILKGILQNGSSYNYPAVRFGRVPKREKARILAAMQSSRLKTQESKVLAEMTDDGKIIETVVRAHYDTCDYTRNKMEPFLAKARASPSYAVCTGTTCPMKGRPENSFLEQFSERFMDHVRQVCTFAKLVPGFKCLHHDDQVTLLKSCVFEVLLVRLAGLFENQGLICLNGDIIRKDTINQMPPGNAKSLMDSVFDLAQRINRFQLSDAEIGLFCAVVIITPDRPGLRNADLVQRMQSKLKMVFNSILLPKHSDHASIFSELMAMIHDLRTLNTLHTEKFLQQCKVQPNSSPNAQQGQQPTSTNWHNPQQVERESTGNASPQSSTSSEDGGGGSSNSSSSRRSPISSVSSSGESICSNEVSKLTHGDLKVSGNVLMNALTVADQAASAAAAAAAANAASSSAATVTTVSRKRVAAAPSGEESTVTKAATGTAAATVTKHKVRKLDSPSDSGIDSPKAGTSHGSHSTNTSVCSSPRSSSTTSEDDLRNKAVKTEKAEKACPPSSSSSSSSSSSAPAAGNPAAAVASAAAAVEEMHPLLKRALEQPPQPYNEVYRPHKKFRRHNIPVSDDLPSSTSTNQASPQSPPPAAHCSLLVSQLSEPPLSHRQNQQHSLLASTLSAPVASSRESRRNEILASLILNHTPPPPQSASSGTPSQGLLMCALKSAPVTPAAEAVGSQQPPSSRHIPVQAAPMKPSSSSSSSAASKMSQLAAAAAAVESSSSTTTSSSEQSEAQPLNLSTTPRSNDIPTEA